MGHYMFKVKKKRSAGTPCGKVAIKRGQKSILILPSVSDFAVKQSRRILFGVGMCAVF